VLSDYDRLERGPKVSVRMEGVLLEGSAAGVLE